MSLRDALLVMAGGLIAGTANVIAGGGSLLTFPLLVALGLPPLDANVTNTVGIVPAGLGGMLGFGPELHGQRGRLLTLLPLSVVGATAGAVLLLTTPAHAFSRIVPALIVVACLVLFLQGRIAAMVAGGGRQRRAWLLRAGLLATAVYGGYFGAGVSVVVLAVLAVTVTDSLQRLNAIKVPLAGAMNLVSGVVFAFFAPVHWAYVLVLAPSTFVGGRIGATAARRIPDRPLRYVVIVLGLLAAGWLQFTQ